MKEIVKRIEDIYNILELMYQREVDHFTHLHNTDGSARGNESLKQLQAQLRSTAKFIGYLRSGTKSKDRECRKLQL